MSLPPPLARQMVQLLGGPPTEVERLQGSSVGEVLRVRAGQRSYCVKLRQDAPPGFFEAEADGLARLAATEAVRVPEVVAVETHPEGSWLVLRHLRVRPWTAHTQERAGHQLAALHGRRGHPPGLERSNFVGRLPQDNRPASDGRWTSFFRERRIAPLAAALPRDLRRAIDALPFEDLLSEPAGGCALLHGDLWAGNALAAADDEGSDDAWFLDPAAYHGHPEVDLAMTRLFGGFGGPFYAAYQEVAGRFDGDLDARLEVHNLYPLLVHLRLFGSAYLEPIRSTVSRYG